jgi:aspartate/methionine/tyrosine aminotransferase
VFPSIAYLDWARRYYGKVRFDLAASGVPPPPESAWPKRAESPTTPDDAGLREAIAHYNRVTVGETVPTLGTTHALWLAYTALLGPGDDVLVEGPVYPPLVCIAQGLGANVRQFERRADAGFALEPDRVASAMTPKTRAIVVTNLHNPSGRRSSADVLRAIAQIGDAQGACLVVDEVYAPFDDLVAEDGTFASTARQLGSNVIAVSSLTKCFGLGPDRIGWMLASPAIVSRAERAIIATTGALPSSHAVQGVRAFRNIQVLAARTRAIVSGKREQVAQWAAGHGYRWSDPTEGLFGFVTLPDREDLLLTVEAAARKHEVLVAPGTFFGIPNGFRIAWGLPADQLTEGLERLAHALA